MDTGRGVEPVSSALVVIDVQKATVAFYCLTPHEGEDAVSRIDGSR
jgi:hypothetical protein